MISSPIQMNQKTKELAFHTRMMADLLKVHRELLKSVEEYKQLVQEQTQKASAIEEHAARITELPQGVPGQKGDKGDKADNTPVLGVDYFTADDHANFLDTVVENLKTHIEDIKPKKGRDYLTKQEVSDIARLAAAHIPLPKDGKSATINHDKLAEAVLGKIKSGKALKVEDIAGLKDEVSSYRHQMAMKQAGQHGGGDTVAAGTGITLTRNSNGTTTIASTASVSPLTPTGTVNSVNATFTVLSRPSSVVSDGITYYEGFGYSYVALTITLDVPPSQYTRYYA